MAILGDADRSSVWSEIMSRLSGERQSLSVTKSDLRSAVDAVDQWVSDNQASFNAALPVAFRNDATASQKALLLMYVVIRRYSVGV